MNRLIKKLITASLFAVGIMAAVNSMAAPALFVLPTPENNPNATYDTYTDATGFDREAILMNGIPVAFKYDDYWS